jgi:hypothetical protein
MHLNS